MAKRLHLNVGAGNLPMPTRSRGPRRPAEIPMQARTSDQDAESVATRMACSKCQITYYVVKNRKATCPLCDAEHRILELQAAMSGMRNQLEQAENSAARLKAAVDIVSAMRLAGDALGDEDRIFLKSVLYRFRAERGSITLRTTHGGTERRPAANGFIAVPRIGEPEAHLCTSIGGVAIAAYYEEADRTFGSAQALSTIMKALNQILGATR